MIRRLACNCCGKIVSTPPFTPIGDPFILRAWIECPECSEKQETGTSRASPPDGPEDSRTTSA